MAENDMNDSHGIELNKFLIISLLSTLILCIVFAGINYFVMENLLTQKISKINVSQEELADEEDTGDEIQHGIVVDLGDFILNLCDEAQKKYLKVNVAIEVSQKDTDFPEDGTQVKILSFHLCLYLNWLLIKIDLSLSLYIIISNNLSLS